MQQEGGEEALVGVGRVENVAGFNVCEKNTKERICKAFKENNKTQNE